MQFQCVHCGHAKTVGKKFQGRQVRCPKCQKKSQVPSQSLVGTDGATLSDTDDPSSSETTGFQFADLPKSNPQKPAEVTPQSNLMPVKEYEVRKGKLSQTVAYPCPVCSQKLTSSLNDAGGSDHCPDCGTQFVVPGEKEYREEEAKKAKSLATRQSAKETRTEATKKAVVNRAAQKQLKNKDIHLDRDPFREWSIYAAVLLTLMIVFAGKYMVAALSNDSSYLTYVIFGLFLVGLFANLRGVLRLRTEYVCAAVCMIELKKLGGLLRVTQGPTAGILQQHIKDLDAIARYDDKFSQDSLITLLYSRMMAKSKMVEILSGVLVTLGLIGTIVGLISMTDGLSSTLASLGDDGEAKDLLSGMRSTMSGLGTAFNTTLVGAILGSVVLRILNNVYTSNVDHLVSYVASTAEVSIVPRLKQQARSGGHSHEISE